MELSAEESGRRPRRGPLARVPLLILKYLTVLRISAANNLAYLLAVLMRSFFLVVLVYILSQLWQTTFANHASLLPGFSVRAMIWYLAAAETMALSLPDLSARIDQEVRGGELAYLLGRPCNYLFYHYARYLGERAVRLFFNALIAALVALLIVGPPDSGWQGLLAWFPMIWLACSIEFACYFAIGLLAFWTENTQPFAFIFSRFTLVLGGVLAPLEILPQPLRLIAQVLPFGSILYGPARMLVRFEPGLFGTLVLQQVLTLAVTGVLAGIFYLYAIRRVSINGG